MSKKVTSQYNYIVLPSNTHLENLLNVICCLMVIIFRIPLKLKQKQLNQRIKRFIIWLCHSDVELTFSLLKVFLPTFLCCNHTEICEAFFLTLEHVFISSYNFLYDEIEQEELVAWLLGFVGYLSWYSSPYRALNDNKALLLPCPGRSPFHTASLMLYFKSTIF